MSGRQYLSLRAQLKKDAGSPFRHPSFYTFVIGITNIFVYNKLIDL